MLIIQSLQGIVSKDKPAIFRDVGTGSSIWINDLIEKGFITASYLYEEDLVGLISILKKILMDTFYVIYIQHRLI